MNSNKEMKHHANETFSSLIICHGGIPLSARRSREMEMEIDTRVRYGKFGMGYGRYQYQ